MKEKNSQAKEFTKRFYMLNILVTILLTISIFISINQFGSQIWHGKTQVALILPQKKDEVGWNKSQYVALKNVCDENDCELIFRESIPMDYISNRQIVEDLSKRGVRNFYFTNGLKLSDLVKIESEFPKINCSTIEIVSALWYSGRYSILTFEASYLAGMLAGLRTKTNKIGYIAPYKDIEVNQGINAFTLGVQRVNQKAEVLLNWTNTWNSAHEESQAVQNLKAEHVDVLTYHQNGYTVPESAKNVGIYFIAYNEVYPDNNFCLASIRIDWTAIYRNLFKYKEHFGVDTTNTAGVASGLINLELSEYATMREKVAIDSARWEIKNGRIIFAGDIFDRNGVKKCSANEAMSLENLLSGTAWLIKGVRIVGN